MPDSSYMFCPPLFDKAIPDSQEIPKLYKDSTIFILNEWHIYN